MITETTLWMDEYSFLEPDFLFFPATTPLDGLRPSQCLMAVEVGVSCLSYDRGRKAQLYAVNGLPELIVIDGETLRSWYFRKPGIAQYEEMADVSGTEQLQPSINPDLAVTLSELDLP